MEDGKLADRKKVQVAAQKERQGREQEVADVQFLLCHEQGRRFIWRYLTECGVFRTSAEHSGSMTYLNEGRRQIGLKLLTDIEHANPEALILMMKEKEIKNA